MNVMGTRLYFGADVEGVLSRHPLWIQWRRDGRPCLLCEFVCIFSFNGWVYDDPNLTKFKRALAAVWHEFAGANERDGHHRHLRLGSDAKGALLEGMHTSIGCARALREDEHRRALTQHITTGEQHLLHGSCVSALEWHMSREEHRPAHDGYHEVAGLADKLETSPERKEREYIQIGGVVGHIHGRAAFRRKISLAFDVDTIKGPRTEVGPHHVNPVQGFATHTVYSPHHW
mmetsp:Transcript_17509/g.54276  ORF Transcript_17509/g.54276 Transcript_17509/m.54276 type:complete len:231 (+) Transcript_17509:123-815(+)